MGASLLDPPSLGIDCAFCVDGAQPIGTVISRALGQTTFVAAIHGRAAHAAANPDAGVDAITTACEAVAALPLGRRPGGGSAGVAAIVGGSVIGRLDSDSASRSVRETLASAPTNSVADLVYVRGEARGYSVREIEDTTQTIQETFQTVCARRGATLEWIRNAERMVPPLPGAPDSRALALVRAAVEGLDGVALYLQEAQASLEANYLAAEVDVVAMASGGRAPHQPGESIAVTELRQLEALLVRIVQLAAEPVNA